MADEMVSEFYDLCDFFYEALKSFADKEATRGEAEASLNAIRNAITDLHNKILKVDRNIETHKIKMYDLLESQIRRAHADDPASILVSDQHQSKMLMEAVRALEKQKMELLADIYEHHTPMEEAWAAYSEARAEEAAAERSLQINAQRVKRHVQKMESGWSFGECDMMTLVDKAAVGAEIDAAEELKENFGGFDRADLEDVDLWWCRFDRPELEPEPAAIEETIRALFKEAGLQLGRDEYAKEIRKEISKAIMRETKIDNHGWRSRLVPAVELLFGRLRAMKLGGHVEEGQAAGSARPVDNDK